tara:strand:- start:1042 stop:1824 length:783 start_codon:yes stop_codon:yes gene_type:complete
MRNETKTSTLALADDFAQRVTRAQGKIDGLMSAYGDSALRRKQLDGLRSENTPPRRQRGSGASPSPWRQTSSALMPRYEAQYKALARLAQRRRRATLIAAWMRVKLWVQADVFSEELSWSQIHARELFALHTERERRSRAFWGWKGAAQLSAGRRRARASAADLAERRDAREAATLEGEQRRAERLVTLLGGANEAALRSLEAAATSTIIGIKVKHAKILSTIEETDAQRLAEAVRVCVCGHKMLYMVLVIIYDWIIRFY